MLTIDTVLRTHYRIDALLGQEEADFGEPSRSEAVYLAWNIHLDRPVIIREMILSVGKPNLDPDTLAELRRQLQQEALALIKLQHPHLVEMIEFFQVDDNAYLVTEFVEGETLASCIARVGALAEAEVVAWADQLLEALSYCHKQKVVHRDIKPQHVIIRSDGQALLGGFGLIKSKPADDLPKTIEPLYSKTALPVVGTAPYASPEEYVDQSLNQIDPRSDLYSLGATMYHALTGQPPPSAASRADISDSAAALYQSLTGQNLSLSPEQAIDKEISIRTRNSTVSPAVEAVVKQAMEMNRHDRFPNAKAMRAALVGKEKVVPAWAWRMLVAILAVGLVGGGWWVLTNSTLASFTPPAIETAIAAVLPTTPTPTNTNTPSPTPTPTDTPTATPTDTPTTTPSPTDTPTATDTSTPTPTATPVPTDTPTATPTNTPTPIPTNTPTPNVTVPGIPPDYVRVRPDDGMVMVYVPAGNFIMGSSPVDGDKNEQPQHIVTLDAFWIDRYEVTNAQFAAFLNEAGNETEGGVIWLTTDDQNIHIQQNDGLWQPTADYEQHPVVGVTWYGARAYCLWYGARLPTEAEWEKAARGTDGRLYPWGNSPADCNKGNYRANDSCVGNTTTVGSYPGSSSPYGALDMAGNVWEWMSDWYGENYYTRASSLNPQGPDSGTAKVLRSGSWSNPESFARTAFRGYSGPANINYNVGFRCVQD